MNVSIRPSGERAGWLTESGILINCTHRSGATGPPFGQKSEEQHRGEKCHQE